MTNREKRWWKSQGVDWSKIEAQSKAETYEVDYSAHLQQDGTLSMPDDMPAEEQLIIHTAAALDLHVHGSLTGRIECPVRIFERCARDVIRYALRSPRPGNCGARDTGLESDPVIPGPQDEHGHQEHARQQGDQQDAGTLPVSSRSALSAG